MKFVLLLFFAFSTMVFSQELDCTVTLNTDNLSSSQKDLLSDFQQNVSDYMNKTHFTSDEWEGGKINCTMSIFILSSTNDINFTAQVVVTSQRPIYETDKNSLMLSINDGQWSFTYQKGQGLYYDKNNFESVSSLLDYYAYVIIGFDLDSWQEFGGTPYFNEALNIVNMGAGSTFSTGWSRTSSGYNRAGLVENLLNDKYRPFREAFYQYYYGIDVYEKNKQLGEKKIVQMIHTLNQLKDKIDFNSVLIRTFFDAKSGEIVQHLKDYPDKSIFVMLSKIDPSHTSKYNAAISGSFN